MSFWACSGNSPRNHEQVFISVVAHAVEPQPRASSRLTSRLVRKSVS